MSVLSNLLAADSIIRKMVVEEKRTLSEVCLALKESFPHLSRGFSRRSVRRYCADNGIHKTSRLQNSMLDRVVWTYILKVKLSKGISIQFS